jgi:hypothetical protein
MLCFRKRKTDGQVGIIVIFPALARGMCLAWTPAFPNGRAVTELRAQVDDALVYPMVHNRQREEAGCGRK